MCEDLGLHHCLPRVAQARYMLQNWISLGLDDELTKVATRPINKFYLFKSRSAYSQPGAELAFPELKLPVASVQRVISGCYWLINISWLITKWVESGFEAMQPRQLLIAPQKSPAPHLRKKNTNCVLFFLLKTSHLRNTICTPIWL